MVVHQSSLHLAPIWMAGAVASLLEGCWRGAARGIGLVARYPRQRSTPGSEE